MIFGIILAVLPGVGLLSLVPDAFLSVLFGSLVMVAVLMSLFSPEVDDA